MLKKKGSIFSASFLLAGYTIGTGFLATPSAAGPSGFWPSAIAGFLIWIFLFCTSLLFLEALLTQPPGSSVATLCQKISGPFASVLAGIALCLLNYYFASSIFNTTISLLKDFFFTQLNISLPEFVLFLGLFVVFFITLYLGTYASDRVNFLLFIFLLISIAGSFIAGRQHVHWDNHMEKNWYLIFFAVPFFLTAYDNQSLLPTLATYLQQKPRALFFTLLIGTGLPFIFYTAWQWFVITSSSSAELWEAFEIGAMDIHSFLQIFPENPLFIQFFYSMTFFAAVTSLIGSGLALFDFWSDAFRIPLEKRVGRKRFIICLGVFVPALFIGWALPVLFTVFPSYFIGFAEVFFLGVLPIWLIIRLRYILEIPSVRFLPGGKISLTLLSLASFILLYLEGLQFFRKM